MDNKVITLVDKKTSELLSNCSSPENSRLVHYIATRVTDNIYDMVSTANLTLVDTAILASLVGLWLNAAIANQGAEYLNKQVPKEETINEQSNSSESN